MNERIRNFLEWAKSQNFHAGVAWFQNEYYVSVSTTDGKKLCAVQDPDLDNALNITINSLRNVGIA